MLGKQFQLHFLVVLWGFTAIAGKLISFAALELVFWRVCFTAAILAVFIFFTKEEFRIAPKHVLKIFGAGAALALNWGLFFASVKASNVSVALSTVSTGALFTAFLEPLFFKRKIALYEVFFALIIAGCLFVIFRANPQYVTGILFGVGSSFFSALFTIFNSFLQRRHSAVQISFYEMIGCLLFIGIAILMVNGAEDLFRFQPLDFLWLLILASVLTAYPMVQAVKLLRHFSPYTFLLAINMEPVYGIFFAYIIFGESEQMTPTFYLAALVMIVVIACNEILKMKRKKL